MQLSQPTEMPTDQSLITALSYVLGNTYRLSRATALFSWNLIGPFALGAADELTAQAGEMDAALPEIAANIRFLGGVASPDLADALTNLPVDHLTVTVKPTAAADVLQNGHSEACLSLQTALDVATDYDEHGSITMLADRLKAHRNHIYRLSLI